MTSADKIRSALAARAGEFVSGEAIAAACGVSRSAVWKAIVALRGAGYEIEAKPNAGYRLLGDVLDSDAARAMLGEGLRNRLTVEVLGEVDSTNLRVRERAAAGEREGLVICASSQSAGRGRMGRSFFSPDDSGLYFSILLRPKESAAAATQITTAAAVAVCRAIESVFSLDTKIKWVNDVFVGSRKVCGILTEAAFAVETGTLDFAVLGIGINVYEPSGGFPPEIADVAGALCVGSEHRPNGRNALLAAILTEFFALYDRLGERPHVDEYRARSIALGQRVTVVPLTGGEERIALVEAITDDAALALRFDDGSRETLTSGEIRVKV